MLHLFHMEIMKRKLHVYSLLEEHFLGLERGSCEHNNVVMLWIMGGSFRFLSVSSFVAFSVCSGFVGHTSILTYDRSENGSTSFCPFIERKAS